MSHSRQTRLVREGPYAAEVEVELIDSPQSWETCISIQDAQKLDRVRAALREGDLAAATELACVFRLTPVGASEWPGGASESGGEGSRR